MGEAAAQERERVLDAARLSSELATAVAADETRRAVDNMKKRSVLTARSYDEFKNLVACAQDGQKAVSSREMEFLGKPGQRVGFMYADQRRNGWKARTGRAGQASRLIRARREAGAGALGGAGEAADPVSVPQNTQDFERFWRRKELGAKERLEVLLTVDVARVFRVEVGDLGGMLRLMHQGLVALELGHEAQVVTMLAQLSSVERFPLAVRFLSAEELVLADELLDRQAPSDVVARLKAAFGLKAKPKTKVIDEDKDIDEDKVIGEVIGEDKAEDKAENKTEDKAEDKAENKTEDKAEDKAENKTEDKAEDKAKDGAEDKAEDKAEADSALPPPAQQPPAQQPPA